MKPVKCISEPIAINAITFERTFEGKQINFNDSIESRENSLGTSFEFNMFGSPNNENRISRGSKRSTKTSMNDSENNNQRNSHTNESWTSKIEDTFPKNSQTVIDIAKNEFSVSYDAKKRVKKKVSLDDFELIRLVGRGGFGKVYFVQDKKSKKLYAMKAFSKKFLISTNNISYTFTEKKVLQNVNFPFIVRLHFAFQTAGRLYIVMDWVNGGQILFHLNNESSFMEDDVRFYACELVMAMEKLHSLGIIHRDLKPENILLDSEGHICITDFGLAKENVDGENATTFCGTLQYMAPEMIKEKAYGKAADWWSIGALIYDMLTGSPPWTHKNEKVLRDRICKGKLKLPPYLTKHCHSFLKGLLQKDPKKRLNIKQIKSHPWFKGVNWNDVVNKKIDVPFQPQLKDQFDLSYFNEKYHKNVKTNLAQSIEVPISKSQDELFHGFSFSGDSAFPLINSGDKIN